MTKQRTTLALLFAALAISSADAQTTIEKAERDELAFMQSDDPSMKRAFEKARATLDNFLRIASAPAPGTSSYALKVKVSDGQSTEYFWVSDFERSGNQFTGTLANEPRMVKKFKNGQRIQFGRNKIVDWTYIDASRKKMLGNFTACALLTKETPDEARKFRQMYGLDCD
jgi:uncharacterized protein YegJ (DUF2314 family)